MPDAMFEVLNILVLITNLMDYDFTGELISLGLIQKLNKFVDIDFIRTKSTLKAAELALQIVANVT